MHNGVLTKVNLIKTYLKINFQFSEINRSLKLKTTEDSNFFSEFE